MNFTTIPATEKENYIEFHKQTYAEDMKHAEKNAIGFPRWSIISAYYGMHNITKLFLGTEHSIKLSSPKIHMKTIEALEHFIKEDKVKKKLLALLKEAKNIYYNTERLKEKVLPAMLKRGKQERAKSQYYTEDYTKNTAADSKKALYFLDTIAKPYIRLIEELMK
ncbi:MAG: hypothetical protein ABIB71_05560 [Candidatus Woesearchaeota archaeon]